MGLDSWCKTSQRCPLVAAELPAVRVGRLLRQLHRGVNLALKGAVPHAPSNVSRSVCLFAAQGAKSLPGLMQDIFLIVWKSNFQAAKWRDSGREGWLLRLQS